MLGQDNSNWEPNEVAMRRRRRKPDKLENCMHRIPALIAALGFAASAAGAQTPADSAASKSALLTLDQKTKISEMITKRTAPLAGPSFPVSVDGVVPTEIQLNSLPSEAEELAPQLRGFSYVVVEELVAIVDPRTRKVEIVFPRWGKQ
jgi:Protein of unknown function (DUF1236)